MKVKIFVVLALVLGFGGTWFAYQQWHPGPRKRPSESAPLTYQPRVVIDSSGFVSLLMRLKPWRDPTNLEEVRRVFGSLAQQQLAEVEHFLQDPAVPAPDHLNGLFYKAAIQQYEGKPQAAYQTLEEARRFVKGDPQLESEMLYSVIFLQGVAALRRGENENCLECRGEGACLFPIRPTAVHTKPAGSRLALQHFTEYLTQFPDDLGVRWLLNLAYMTLGEYPERVPTEYVLKEQLFGTETSIGRFKDVAHLVGVNRLNQGGAAVMDDFDNDGLLDIIITTYDATQSMAFYRNQGDGTFADKTEVAGLAKQYGGLNLTQVDYDNDGFLDLFVPRGAWQQHPIRPSLLRNNGNGTFTDVTQAAGLLDPLNSICATWADYDNDGFADLFIANERGANRLYRNRGNGTFVEVAGDAGVQGRLRQCKGAVWFDYDNDGYPDLFLTYLEGTPQLFHNNRDGRFTDVTQAMGLTKPEAGFSCWAFDYDNDGYIDIFATCYARTIEDLIGDALGQVSAKKRGVTRLFRNIEGKRFEDVSAAMGVDGVFATMGSNFGDFDNDGYLDFYLATGDPLLSTLIPNRMFKNMAGQRFTEITATARTGHLQKGHGVAIGDWNRDGAADLFVQMGGATPGDRFHNALFQNPGQGNHWLNVKLVGTKTNRAALGVRIKAVTAGPDPQTIQRYVTHGSSFGGNPLEQHLGLGKAERVALLEITWPTSGTKQIFRDLAANQGLVITEGAMNVQQRQWSPIAVPKD